MSTVEIKFNSAQLRSIQRQMQGIPNGMPKVMSRAINKTAAKAYTKIVKMAAEQMGVKQKAIRKRIKLYKATYRKWRGLIWISDTPLSLINYQARQTKKGVAYTWRGERVLEEHAFIATMPDGRKGVFTRGIYYPDGPDYYAGAPRLPIHSIKGSSVADEFNAGIAEQIQKQAFKDLENNIDSQVKYILERYRRAG